MRTNKNIKILLVDDEQSILQFLELGLTEEGFEVYIRLLREKLHDPKRTFIRTIRGAGYRLDLA